VANLKFALIFAVNEPFMVNSWAKTFLENKLVKLLADGVAKYTNAFGLSLTS